MKKIYFTLVVTLCTLHHMNAQYYQQYFDGEDTSVFNSILIELDTSVLNIWQIGKPQKTIFNSASTVPNALITDTINTYPLDDTSRFIAKVLLDFGNFGIFALQWKQKLDMDEHLDGGIIEYSVDSGSTWINVFNNPYVYNFYGFDTTNLDTLANGVYAFSGQDTAWKNIWLCFNLSWLQQYGFSDTVLFRFTFLSDSLDNSREGWMIDNMLAHVTYPHTIQEVKLDNYINVYPNPANKIVNIETEKINGFHIIELMELIDQEGRVVDRWEKIPTKFWFETKKYSSGTYFLKIRTNLKSETIPININNN